MKSIDSKCVESVSRILGELVTGSEITSMFEVLNLPDFDINRTNEARRVAPLARPIISTKWRRINESIVKVCVSSHSATPFFSVIEYIMRPQEFMENPELWTKTLSSINSHLMFYGYELGDNGKIAKVSAPTTFGEAQLRLQSLDDRLSKLEIHPEILKYCKEELLTDNYFHAILEASKGLLDRVRRMSETTDDGNTLINNTFSLKHPLIVIRGNMLETQTERSKYSGLKSLLNTVVYLYRNPNAHEPKLYDVTSETDAITAFTLMSLAHKTLDNCSNVRDL